MENDVCIDTNLLADFLREKEYAIEWFRDNQHKNLAASSVTLFELYFGAWKHYNDKNELQSINGLKNNLSILHFDDGAAMIAGEQLAKLESEGNVIELEDLFIGSIALAHGFALKTNNKKHFERIKGLKII